MKIHRTNGGKEKERIERERTDRRGERKEMDRQRE